MMTRAENLKGHAIRNETGEAMGPRIIILLGAPGSGKGTQGALLSARYGVPTVSTGALLREESKKNTPSGFRLRQTLAAGALVDDQVVFEAVAARIRTSSEARDGGLILDGFPRTVAQARMLDRLLASMGMAAPLVLHLDVPREVLRTRLAGRRQCATCGAVYNLRSGRSGRGSRCEIDGGALVERDDDSEGVVERRLAAYEAETLPVLEYYRWPERGGCYRRLDGNRGPAEVTKELCGIVGFLGATGDDSVGDTAVAA